MARFHLPLRTVGGDGIGRQYVALPAPDRANHPGLLSVRQRDTVTGNRCHRPDAVGHITALPVTFVKRIRSPVPTRMVSGVYSVTPSATAPRAKSAACYLPHPAGYQPVILADTGNPVIHIIHRGQVS